MSGHVSRPRQRAPSSAPKQSSRSVPKIASAARLPARDALDLAQLLERVDPDVRVGADAERDPAVLDPRGREEAVAEVGLRRRAGADRRSRLGEQVELRAVGVGGVHDGRPRAEAAGAGEELDRPAAVLGEALLDLARLLAGVDVQRQLLGGRVPPDLLEPVGRAGANRVGGDARRATPRPAAPRPARRYSPTDSCRIRSRPPRP